MARPFASWNHAKGLATPMAKRSHMHEAVLAGLRAPIFAIAAVAVVGATSAAHWGVPRTEAFVAKLVPQHPAPLIHPPSAPAH